MKQLVLLGMVLGLFAGAASPCLSEDEAPSLTAGFAKVDITPTEAVRLSGYAARTSPMEGVDTPLYARAAAFQWGDNPPMVLVTVDSIGFPGVVAKEVFEALPEEIQADRARFVMTATHSHTAPHIARGLSNLFFEPPTAEQEAATARYTNFLRDKAIEAAKAALADLKPARLFVGQGETGFARNRRLGANPAWQGQDSPEGSVDHSVPVIKLTSADGKTVRGLIFNYACHCTTFGPGHNRVNGDWAGYASADLEDQNPGAVALCTIGCGADANPEREGPEQLQLSQKQGRMLSEEVKRVVGDDLREVTAAATATFGYAGLPVDRPTVPELQERLKSGDPNVRRHAETMLDVHERMGRLPETYPMPIQVWRFNDQFVMIFLGGEVVVDYAHRIKRELAQGIGDEGKKIAGPFWVTAYANDIFGYVASERVRNEGGYETDSSMIYYNQPGRWSTGTEEVVMKRVHELVNSSASERALSVNEALKTFTVPEGYTIDAIATEPLIVDPVNFALGADGRLWVVEMTDYPRGLDEHGQPGGQIKVLSDRDQDGRYDKVQVFLDGLAYPTGVWPWRDGAIISAAPDIIFAKDSDGDGQADTREVLYSGFVESNPQHRINGFAYGLDGWLYLASGDTSHKIHCRKTGETIDMAGRDIRIDPDSGRLETLSGKSQYGRVRDDANNWFGNTNGEPFFHYVIDDSDLRRNPFVRSINPIRHLPAPPAIGPVYPTSRTADRFNDLWTANRFTSACSPWIIRDERLGAGVHGAGLVCEPVHNLVSRLIPKAEGVTFSGRRLPSEEQSEFLSSTDGWFRPVRLMTAPDGSLWVADMYRRVIEHTEWIPEAWQAQINVRAGEDRGRIYRVAPKNTALTPVRDYTALSTAELVQELKSLNGWTRDTAQQLLMERNDPKTVELIDQLAESSLSAAGMIQAMWLRSRLEPTAAPWMVRQLDHADADVRRNAVRVLGTIASSQKPLREIVLKRSDDDSLTVRYELALVVGDWNSNDSTDVLAALVIRDFDDPWMRAAVLSSASNAAERLLHDVLKSVPESEVRTDFVASLTSTALGEHPEEGATHILEMLGRPAQPEVEGWEFSAMAACLDGLARNQSSLSDLQMSGDAGRNAVEGAQWVFAAARQLATDSDAPLPLRQNAVSVLGRGVDEKTEDLELLATLLSPQQPSGLQQACVTSLVATNDETAPELLLASWKSLEPDVRSGIVNSLLMREAWTSALLTALEEERIHASELDAASRSRLTAHASSAISERAAKVLQPPAARQEVLNQYRSVFELSGESQRGAAIFQKTCAVCHRMHERGTDLGARLAALQDKSTENLLTSILDPNRSVEGKYLSYTAATADGRTFAGLIVEETATSIALARPDGKRDTLLRIDLDQLVSSGKSFMPEGLEKELTPQDLADVIAFVQAESVP